MSGGKLLLLRASHVNPDPRVARAVAVAEASGLDTTVLAWNRDRDASPAPHVSHSPVVRYAREAAHGRGMANLIGLVLFQLFLARQVLGRRRGLVAIHACDLSTGATGLLLARVLRVPLIYDIYDYYVDSFPVPGPARSLVRRVETFVIEHADTTILPTDVRREQISPAEPRELVIVENSPDIGEVPIDATLPTTDLAYVGILAHHRLLREVVAHVASNPGISLRIAGFGPLEGEIRSIAEASPNIDFRGRVDSVEALAIMASARVLFATYEPTVPNHRYSAPNKLGEALALGKPLIVCRRTGMDVEVERAGVGVAIDYDGDAFGEALSTILSDDNLLEHCREEGPRLYRDKHSWPVSASRLQAVYHGVGRPPA